MGLLRRKSSISAAPTMLIRAHKRGPATRSPGRRAADPTSSAAAEETFRTLNQVLGTTIGETLGYTLTALWTVW
jgi:hypothetical protein